MSEVVDLTIAGRRALNGRLHALGPDAPRGEWRVDHPGGIHALAVGIDAPVKVRVAGHAGYYCAAMNRQAEVVIEGNAGVGVAENMMSGSVRVCGNAGQAAGASACGGLLVVEGDAGPRCGIAIKGADIVVRGSIGAIGAFMGQAGNLLVCGDAGPDLGDSLYEARLFVRGRVASLGTDCTEKEMRSEHVAFVARLLAAAEIDADAAAFRRYGSARKLYHFHVDNAGAY